MGSVRLILAFALAAGLAARPLPAGADPGTTPPSSAVVEAAGGVFKTRDSLHGRERGACTGRHLARGGVPKAHVR